jgi:hypothetical protein
LAVAFGVGLAALDLAAGGSALLIAGALQLRHRHCLAELRDGVENLADQLGCRTVIEERTALRLSALRIRNFASVSSVSVTVHLTSVETSKHN